VPKVKKRGEVRKGSRGKAEKPGSAPSGASSTFEVRQLDPIRKCGARTSVERLYRVDEFDEARTRVHLVFFDRHGWYCEHGRDCPAVRHARELGDRARPTGRNSQR